MKAASSRDAAAFEKESNHQYLYESSILIISGGCSMQLQHQGKHHHPSCSGSTGSTGAEDEYSSPDQGTYQGFPSSGSIS